MEERDIPAHYLSSMSFGMYSKEELLKLSVKEVTNPQIFDSLMHATHGGLYDPVFGPQDRDDICPTCGLSTLHCPGHMGHMTLPLPVYNPAFFKTLFQLLRGTCFNCHRLVVKPKDSLLFIKQMEVLDLGLLNMVDELQSIVHEVLEESGGGDVVGAEQRAKIDERTKKATSGLSKREAKRTSHVKNVVFRRQQLVKEFLRGDYFNRKTCLHCQVPLRPLRSEHQAKIFFEKDGLSKRSRKILQQKKQQAIDKLINRPEDAEVDDVTETPTEVTQDAAEKQLLHLDEQMYLTPAEAQSHLHQLWATESGLLGAVLGALNLRVTHDPAATGGGGGHPTDFFFLDIIPVPPSRFRPVAAMKDLKFENGQTANLCRCLKDIMTMRELLGAIREDKVASGTKTTDFKDVPGTSLKEKLQSTWLRLQTFVNCVVDSDLDKLSKDKNPGIKQLIEKKQGLFRKHMMGKRVNFAARSVISPDPYINTNEVGVPHVFAVKLTYPEPVTPWNFQELKAAVINGPNVHPGAIYVEHEDGTRTFLKATDRTQRESIAKQLLTPKPGVNAAMGSKKVLRHIRNGDIMLLNRQPTLHKPSIQAHRARILPGEKTLRLHYANCKAYNADFDGDEMNAHFPQNEIARAEAYNIVGTDHNYLVPKDGTPLAGLIQDHMVSGVTLMMRGRFFHRPDYQQLVYSALTDVDGPVRTLPPALIKPDVMWSGKQVLSSVLLNVIPKNKAPLNLQGVAKVSSKNWNNACPSIWMYGGTPLQGLDMSESEVVISQGELLVGVLDKGHYGNTPYGLVHACYELYGGAVAGRLLTALARLFTAFLQYRGFTLGVEDILVTEKANHKRKKIIRRSKRCGPEVAAKALQVENSKDSEFLYSRLQEAHFSTDGGEMKDLDLQMKSKTDEIQNEIVKVSMPVGLEKKFPHNNLQLMVQTGAKGSMVNCLQISCLLGQIELEGRRPPISMSGRSLPSFLPYDTSPRAGGFVAGRFLTGIRPQEYFFHCMAGREGLVDTAVKTSRSGYLQRCLIKHIEGLIVAYDMTVRDSDGSIVQFQYGEDGVDVAKTAYLNNKQFPFLIHNHPILGSRKELREFRKKMGGDQPYTGHCSHMFEENVSLNNAVAAQKEKIAQWRLAVSVDTGGEEGRGEQRRPRRSGFLSWVSGQWARLVREADQDLAEPSDQGTQSQGDTGTQGTVVRAPKVPGRDRTSVWACRRWQELSQRKRNSYAKKIEWMTHVPEPLTSVFRQERHLGVLSERMDAIIEGYLKDNPHNLIMSHKSKAEKVGIVESHFRSVLHRRYQQSLVQPGEAVGLLAAQSIGEPSTQMTLNTFHFAGRGEMNVTLGIPRLREILMVASANIKTPSMEIPVRDSPQARRKSKILQQKLTKVYLSQVIENIVVTESLSVKGCRDKSRLYTVRFNFLPHEMYRREYYLTPAKILAYMERRFIKRLQDVAKKRMEELQWQKLLSNQRLKRSAAQNSEDADTGNPGNGDDDELVDDDLHDDDSTARKNRERQMEDRDYDGEEEERGEVGDDDHASSDEEAVNDEGLIPMEDNGHGSGSGRVEEGEGEAEEAVASRRLQKLTKQTTNVEMDPRRVNGVVQLAPTASKYSYDAEEELWCEVSFKFSLYYKRLNMASVVESEARRAVVHQTPGISRCFLTESRKPGQEGLRLKTEGMNITEMYNYEDVLDLNQLYTNDIHAVHKTYGIEAACRVLIKEIRDVFAAYGIGVDYRHLSLVADYMTFEGSYKPFNRAGIESNASPLQKMTFETTMHFLKTAVMLGSHDQLKSPSSRLVVGRLVGCGTGCFDLMQPL